ncbi:MAG: hypothetical protein ACI8XC_003079 [Gammaproteobacteria bacterium]
MSTILTRTLIFVALMVAGVLIYSIGYGVKADRYDEVVVPYLDEAIPKITSWQFDQLDPLLSAPARIEFETEKGKNFYRLLSTLGYFKSSGKPEFRGDGSETIGSLGTVDSVTYQIPLEFSSGPAVMKINLLLVSNKILIHHFGIHSEIFTPQATD